MPDLSDLQEILEPETLTLPIGRKKYVVQPATAATWLRLTLFAERADALAAGGDVGESLEKAGLPESELYQLALGDVFDTLLAEVSAPELKRAALTAFYWHLQGNDVAARVWSNTGKALTPNRATRRSAPKSTGSPSPRSRSTASASKTR